MSRNPYQNILAPNGMDSQSDPVFMETNRAQLIVNWLIDKPGRLLNQVRLKDVFATPSLSSIDGISWYYGATIQNNVTMSPLYTDLLVWVASGFLQVATPPADPFTQSFGNISPVFGGITGYILGSQFVIGKRVRFAALQSELLIVQQDGLVMLRFYSDQTHGTGLFRSGIQPPNITGGTVAFTATAVAAAGGLTGTWLYKLTFADERDRESSPSDPISVTLAAQGTEAHYDTTYTYTGAYGGSNLVTAYLYRNTQGTPDTFYRIAAATIPASPVNPVKFVAANFLFNPAPVDYDEAADADIVDSVIAPAPGENDPPNPASAIAIYNNRVFANDVTDNTTLQISNLLNPTGWTILSTGILTDGLRTNVGTDQGDQITALVPFGSVLGIFKRRGLWFLYGTDQTNFTILSVHQYGCIAPDSAVRCGNFILFLSDDGVYSQAYQGGDTANKLSLEIQDMLLSHTEEERENSAAFFVDNRYHLQCGDTIYVYDFSVLGWCLYRFNQQLAKGINTGEIGDDSNPNGPPPECVASVNITEITADTAGGDYSVSITNTGMVQTKVVSSASWITLSAVPLLSGVLTITVTANTGAARTATISVCGNIITITQAAVLACSVAVSTNSIAASSAGGSYSVTVTPGNAAVTPYSSSVPWITVTGPPTGSGTATIVVAANAGVIRSGFVTICEEIIIVDQVSSVGGCDFTATFVDSLIYPGPQSTLDVASAGSDHVWQRQGPYFMYTDPTIGVIGNLAVSLSPGSDATAGYASVPGGHAPNSIVGYVEVDLTFTGWNDASGALLFTGVHSGAYTAPIWKVDILRDNANHGFVVRTSLGGNSPLFAIGVGETITLTVVNDAVNQSVYIDGALVMTYPHGSIAIGSAGIHDFGSNSPAGPLDSGFILSNFSWNYCIATPVTTVDPTFIASTSSVPSPVWTGGTPVTSNNLLTDLVEYWSPIAGVWTGRHAGNNGTFANAPSVVADGSVPGGFAVVFAVASLQYAIVPDFAAIDAVNDFTVSVRVNVTTGSVGGSTPYIMSKFDVSSSPRPDPFGFALFDPDLTGYVDGSDRRLFISTAPTTGVWQYLTITYDATTGIAEFFIDGVSQGTETGYIAGAVNAGTHDLYWASFNGSFGPAHADICLDGKISDSQAWSRILSPTEIGQAITLDYAGYA